MQELILALSYIISAFIPVLISARLRGGFSPSMFWLTWLVSLVGAFAGGTGGAVMMAQIGMGTHFFGHAIPALSGSLLLTWFFVRIRRLPGNW